MSHLFCLPQIQFISFSLLDHDFVRLYHQTRGHLDFYVISFRRSGILHFVSAMTACELVVV